MVCNQRGNVPGFAQKEFNQFYPRPGWVEHDPEEIWKVQLACAREALRKAKIDASKVAAIGIANQRETTVVWERASGKPIYNAIVWQDRRTADQCGVIKRDGPADLIVKRTGLVPDPYFSATKLAWILEKTGARKKAMRGELAFGTIDSWLIWKLSGGEVHVTDPSNASRTMLYDIHHGRWCEELLKYFRIPHTILPEVQPSSWIVGQTDRSLFGKPIAIAGIAGDQQSAMFGQACNEPGMAKNTYGTGCFMLLNTGEEAITSKNGLLTTSAAVVPGNRPEFALEGSVFSAGSVIQWLRDELRIIRNAGESEALASSVRSSNDVYLVPAFTGLGAPHWDPYARGAIVGLTRGSTRGHIARAALESIAFQSNDLLGAMQRDAKLKLTELRVDGGASSNDLLMQFQADLLGVPVVRPRISETTALGAAYLAGIATGVWSDRLAVSRQWRIGKKFKPRMTRNEAEERISRWREAVHKSRSWMRPSEKKQGLKT